RSASPLTPADPALFAQEFDRFSRDFQPVGPEEISCVYALVAAHCHFQNLDRIEREFWSQPQDLTAILPRLRTLGRYHAKFEPLFYSALHRLLALQDARQNNCARTNPTPPSRQQLTNIQSHRKTHFQTASPPRTTDHNEPPPATPPYAQVHRENPIPHA